MQKLETEGRWAECVTETKLINCSTILYHSHNALGAM